MATPIVNDDSFAIAENAPVGTLVGTVTATDADEDILTYSIANGNLDPDSDGTPAFAIAPDTGEITVADSGDLDFETTPNFNLTVEVSDGESSGTAEIAVTLDDALIEQSTILDTFDSPGGLNPDRIDVFLAPGDPLTLEVTATAPDATVGDALDLVLLQDLSGSFGDDLPVVEALFPDLVDSVRATRPDSQFAVTSYIDKPITPFGNDSDFVYSTDQPLTADESVVQEALANLVLGSGGDLPESQIEALLQVAVRETEVGFRPDSQRVVLLTTDAPFHVAGDGAAAGIDTPNNGDAVLDGDPPGTGEDFPSIPQLRDALLDANIIPIFAVTSDAIADYETLVEQLGFGAVAELTSDSSNLVEVINEGLEVLDDIALVPDEDNLGNVESITPSIFEEVDSGETVTFEVTLEADGIFENDRFTLVSPGFGETVVNIGENQPPLVTDARFSIDENSPVDTLLGTIVASDPNDDEFTFSIADAPDPDGDGIPAFAIDADTGAITVADSDDLDFETTPVFNLDVIATDTAGLTDEADVIVDLVDISGDIVNLPGSNLLSVVGDPGDILSIRFTTTDIDSSNVNSIGFYAVEDTNGTVGGLVPGDAGYATAAINQGEIVYSVLANQGEGAFATPIAAERIFTLNDDLFGLYIVENSTPDAILSGETSQENLRLGLDSDVLEISGETGGLSLRFLGGEVTLNAEGVDSEPPLGSSLQGAPQRELLDLTTVSGTTTVTLASDVRSNANFDNLVGLYVVDGASGVVDGIAPGSAGYAQAALNRAVGGFSLRGGAEGETTAAEFGSIALSGGAIYAPFIIANGGDGTVANFLSSNPNNIANNSTSLAAYFPYIAANPDGVDHLRLLGDNTFGFEDLPGGGDRDFNDLVFELELA